MSWTKRIFENEFFIIGHHKELGDHVVQIKNWVYLPNPYMEDKLNRILGFFLPEFQIGDRSLFLNQDNYWKLDRRE